MTDIVGSAGNDILTGSPGADSLSGLAGDDTLDAAGGAGDLLNGGTGNDILNGGAGADDAAYYIEATSGVSVDLQIVGPQAVGGGHGIDTLIEIESLRGSDFGDTLTGNGGSNYIVGRAGDDILSGVGGDDNLEGGVGNDTLLGGDDNDVLKGGAGNDLLDGGTGPYDLVAYDAAAGGVIVDLRVVGPQTVGGGEGVDTLIGIEALYGSAFNDTLTGDGGANNLVGQAGNDVLDGADGVDNVDYFGATSGVTVNLSLVGPQNVGGGQGVDTLINFENVTGSQFNDTLTGDAGVNVFDTRGGNDLINGSAGYDTVALRSAPGGMLVNLGQAGVNATGPGGNITLISIEGVLGSPFNDTLTGNALDNTFQGQPGDDVLDGAGGIDTADYYEAKGNVQASLSVAGPQNIGATEGLDTFLNIENLGGGAFNDTLTGSALANYINGQAGDDLVIGLLGNDFLEGWAGNDTLQGGEDADFLHGGEGNDLLDGGASGSDGASYADATGSVLVNLTVSGPQDVGGGAGVDTLLGIENLYGSEFNDTLIGDASTNLFAGRGGNDVLDGAGGVDIADYFSATSGVTVNLNLAGPQAIGGGQGVDTLISIEFVVGSQFGDTLTGNAGGNVFDSRGGNDVITGGAGHDTVGFRDIAGGMTINLGQAGVNATGPGVNATLTEIEGLIGSAFNDTLTGDAQANTFQGKAGNDSLDGGAGIDTADYNETTGDIQVSLAIVGAQNIGAAEGLDTLVNFENLTGGGFNDTLSGDAGANFIDGRAGNDSLAGAAGNDNLFGGTGNDIVDGGADNDVVQGAGGNDTVLGGDGADQLLAGAGDDLVDGGSGTDLAFYIGATAGVAVSLAIAGPQAVGADQGLDTLLNIEQLFGSNFSDTLTGDSNSNFLGGHVGNDSLVGGDGVDYLRGGAGDDVLDGGNAPAVFNGDRNIPGGDLAEYADATVAVTADLAIAGPQAVGVGLGLDTFLNLEGLFGGTADDLLSGDNADNNLGGNAGNDTLRGRDGNDILGGGAGDDLLDGGSGKDIVGYFLGATGGVTVDLSLTTAQVVGGGHGTDTLISIESLYGSAFGDQMTGDANDNYMDGQTGSDTLIGDGGADELLGQEGADSLLGGSGDDTVSGEAGNDVINGGAGSDVLDGGDGIDVGTYADATAGVKVNLADAGVQNTLGAGSDRLQDVENLIGSAFHDVLEGNATANVLGGREGNDGLEGRGGADTLDGGAGFDGAIYTGSATGILVNLGTGAASGGDAQGDVLIGIENLYGSLGADSLAGDGGPNALYGSLGADSVSGGGGDDVVDGGQGDDLLTGGAGSDSLYGGDGNDIIVFSGVVGDYDVGTLPSGTIQFAHVRGATTDGTDVVDGGELFRFANGDFTAQQIVAAPSSASLTISPASVTHAEGNSGSTAYTFTVTRAVYVTGTTTVDWAVAGSSDDPAAASDFTGGVLPSGTVSFGVGETSKTITVNLAGDNTLEPTESFTVTLSNASGGASIPTPTAIGVITNDDLATSLALSPATVTLAEGNSGSTAFNFTVTRSGDISGATSADWTVAGSGTVAVQAIDFVDGVLPSGTVSFAAGETAKTIVVTVQGDQTFEAAEQFTVALTNPSGGTLGAASSATGVILNDDPLVGDNLNNSLLGGAGNDQISGLAGNDALSGFAGNDSLAGGAGTDSLDGGVGNNTLDGGSGIDTVSYTSAAGSITVDLAVAGPQASGSGRIDTLLNIENVTGSSFDDRIGGNGASNVLDGGSGNDTLEGQDGRDTLLGGAGNDLLLSGAAADYSDGGDGIDTVSYAYFTSTSSNPLNVNLVTGRATAGFGYSDVLINVENLTGGPGGDVLTGDGGRNVLRGEGGNDTFSGGGGGDSFYGGAGADRIVFSEPSDSPAVDQDIIFDFKPSEGDKIDLSRMDAVVGTNRDDAFTVVGAFTNVSGQLTSAFVGDHYELKGDVNGDGVADFVINIYSPGAFGAGSFIL